MEKKQILISTHSGLARLGSPEASDPGPGVQEMLIECLVHGCREHTGHRAWKWEAVLSLD